MFELIHNLKNKEKEDNKEGISPVPEENTEKNEGKKPKPAKQEDKPLEQGEKDPVIENPINRLSLKCDEDADPNMEAFLTGLCI